MLVYNRAILSFCMCKLAPTSEIHIRAKIKKDTNINYSDELIRGTEDEF
jgi:hypothetical protein